jgi:hypothetical protein
MMTNYLKGGHFEFSGLIPIMDLVNNKFFFLSEAYFERTVKLCAKNKQKSKEKIVFEPSSLPIQLVYEQR